MIEFIELFNIQNHKHTRIDLKEGLTCITGETDSGKTAYQMAFDSVVYRGEMEIHYNESEGKIKIAKDGRIIERIRIEEMERKKCPNCKTKIEGMQQFCPSCDERLKRKKVEDYYLIDGKRTKDTGLEVPEEVLIFFNMKKVEVGNDKISLNLFPKEDVKSFVDIDASQRMEVLGVIGKDLVELENKSVRINKEVKEIQDSIKLSKKEQKFLQNKLKKYEILDKLEPKVKEYEEKKIKVEEMKQSIDEINKLIKEYIKIHEMQNCFPMTRLSPLKFDISLESVFELIKKSQINFSKYESFLGVNLEIHYEDKHLPLLMEFIDRLKYIEKQIQIYKVMDYPLGLQIDDLSSLNNLIEQYQKIPQLKSIKIGNCSLDLFHVLYDLYYQLEETKINLQRYEPLSLKDYNFQTEIYSEITNILHFTTMLDKMTNDLTLIYDEIYDLEEEVEEYQEELKGVDICPLCNKGDFHECI